MARTIVTEEMKEQMRFLYAKYGTYAAVAREIGVAATTVKKYVTQETSKTATVENITEFNGELPLLDKKIFNQTKNWGNLCVYTDEEEAQLSDFLKEVPNR